MLALIYRRRRATVPAATVNRTDTFNRADTNAGLGTPSDGGSAWIARFGTLGISGNAVYLVADVALDPVTGFYNGAAATLTCSANGTVSMDRTGSGSNANCGLFVRWNASGFWMIRLNDSTVVIERVDGGSVTPVYSGASAAGTISTPATLVVVLTASGFDVKTIVGGVTRLEKNIADTTYNSAVEHGPILRNVNVSPMDNFSFVGA